MSSIKARTVLRNGHCEARILLRHPMSVGGRGVAPHFIERVECRLNDRLLLTAHWGAGISRNPYLSFSFRDAVPGDRLGIRWHDNTDASDALELTL